MTGGLSHLLDRLDAGGAGANQIKKWDFGSAATYDWTSGVFHLDAPVNMACARVDASKLTELVVTNSIDPAARKSDSKKVRTISVAPLMGDAIWRIANEQSVSSLFE